LEVKSETQAEILKACGIPIRDGKVSRKDMERAWKISGAALGEVDLNVERLRRDK
jgi:hypothetical protein